MAYMANTSRGKPITIIVSDEPAALAAYEDGKRIYFTRRGPRAFACYHCHWEAGHYLPESVGEWHAPEALRVVEATQRELAQSMYIQCLEGCEEEREADIPEVLDARSSLEGNTPEFVGSP